MASGMDFNPSFFKQLGHSSGVRAECVSIANEVAANARSSAPVDTGAYRAGIKVKVESHGDRNVAVVVASDEKSLLIESQTGNLARALRGVGRG